LAPTVGIAATGFGIRAGSFKLSSTRSANFPSAISANFFYIIKINKFCGCSSSQMVSRKIKAKSQATTITSEILRLLVVGISKSPKSASRRNQQVARIKVIANWTPSSFINQRPTGGFLHKVEDNKIVSDESRFLASARPRHLCVLQLKADKIAATQAEEIEFCWQQKEEEAFLPRRHHLAEMIDVFQGYQREQFIQNQSARLIRSTASTHRQRRKKNQKSARSARPNSISIDASSIKPKKEKEEQIKIRRFKVFSFGRLFISPKINQYRNAALLRHGDQSTQTEDKAADVQTVIHTSLRNSRDRSGSTSAQEGKKSVFWS
jgi:hypothetical protein